MGLWSVWLGKFSVYSRVRFRQASLCLLLRTIYIRKIPSNEGQTDLSRFCLIDWNKSVSSSHWIQILYFSRIHFKHNILYLPPLWKECRHWWSTISPQKNPFRVKLLNTNMYHDIWMLWLLLIFHFQLFPLL